MKDSCGIVFFFDNKILLVRSTPSFLEQRAIWGFPKGVRDEGESLVEAAIRETREECGILVTEKDLQPLVVYKGKHKKFHFFICHQLHDEKQMNCTSFLENGKPEIDQYKWVTLEEASNLIFNHMTNVIDAMTERLGDSLQKSL